VSNILNLILKQLKKTVHFLGGITTRKPIGQREAIILEKLELKVFLPPCAIKNNRNKSVEKAF